MTKKLIILQLFLILGTTLNAQKNLINSQVGIVFCGIEKTGILISLGYENFLNEKWSIAPSIDMLSFGNLQKVIEPLEINHTASAKTFDTTIFRYFNIKNKIKINIGVGSYLRNYIYISQIGSNVFLSKQQYDLIPIDKKLPYGSMDFDKYILGYSIKIGFKYKIDEKISFTFREVFQDDINNNLTISSRLGLSYTF